MKLARIVLFIFLCFTNYSAWTAQEVKVSDCPTLIAVPLSAAPVLDGKVDDAVWAQASELTGFKSPANGEVVNPVKAHLGRFNNTLYIAVRCEMPTGAKPKMVERGFDGEVWLDESVEIFIDPQVTSYRYYHFIVTPNNSRRDETGDLHNEVRADEKWNGAWQSATQIGADYWSVEFAIPFSDLGLPENEPVAIGLNLMRNDTVEGTGVNWSFTAGDYHQPMRFGAVVLPVEKIDTLFPVTLEPVGLPKLGNSQFKITVECNGLSLPPETQVFLVADDAKSRQVNPVTNLTSPDSGKTLTGVVDVATLESGNYMVGAVVLQRLLPLGFAKNTFTLPDVISTKIGHPLRGGEALGIWWADSMSKIMRDQVPADATTDAIRLSAAANEFEAVQIVLHPETDCSIKLEAGDLTSSMGLIPASAIKLLEVAYVPVMEATDNFGWVDEWPDPLPPIEGELACQGGRNQPVWILVKVPEGTPAGLYTGAITIQSNGKSLAIPMQVRVYGFSLTDETHTVTAYGVAPDFGFLGVTDIEQQKQVHDLYMQDCRDHRIAPYNPMAFYPMDITIHGPRTRVTSGHMSIEVDQGQPNPWRLFWDDKLVATQEASMTQFERDGIGYQGLGISWPKVQMIESITTISTSPTMQVLEIVGAHIGSGAAERKYKYTFRLYIPAGDDWFGVRLIEIENTDTIPYAVRDIYNIPKTEFTATQVANGERFTAWSDGKNSFGMLALGDESAIGLGIETGEKSVTVSSSGDEFWLKQGESHAAWGPMFVYFVADGASSEQLATRAARLKSTINPDDPASYKPTSSIPLVVDKRDDFAVTHNFTQFDIGAKRYLDDFKLTGFSAPVLPNNIAGEPGFTDEYKRLHKLVYGPVEQHLREKGWLNKAYCYWYDEPEESAYEYVNAGMAVLKENIPGVKRLLTEQPEPELFGGVNLWVPLSAYYIPDICQERQKLDEHVWWYVCCGPRAPYANHFIDHPGIAQRIRFWQAEQYNIEGDLYWHTCWYGIVPGGALRNPWTTAMSYTPDATGTWGNGDGMLLYPACRERSTTPVIAGPVVSQRWELLRDGIEDREYFWRLKQEIKRLEALRETAGCDQLRLIDTVIKRANRALLSPLQLSESPIHWTKSSYELLRERDNVARAIEECIKVK